MIDLILYNGNIITMDPIRPRASVLAAEQGRVVALGRDEVTDLAGPETELIDLNGKTALPGLTDSHVHFYDWALSRKLVPLDKATSLDQLLDLTAAAAKEAGPEAWLCGRGLDVADWPVKRFPSIKELDQAGAGRPVFYIRRDMHLAVANSKALELAGVDGQTPNPADGIIVKDSAGQPTGVLRELAMNLVSAVIPEPSEEEAVQAMEEAMAALNAQGLTGVMDQRVMGGIDGQAAWRAWQRLRRENRMSLRVWANMPGERLDELAACGLRTGFGDDWLRLGQVKFFSDGSMGARTAWLLAPYLNGKPGLPLTPIAEIEAAALKAGRSGWAVAVHAIGDKANREVIDMFTRVAAATDAAPTAPPTAPSRIEHVQMNTDEDIPKLAALGLTASIQPQHITDDIGMTEDRVGERSALAFRFRDLKDAGVLLTMGSDCPVSAPNPMWGVHAAVTRQRRNGFPDGGWHPEQRLTVDEAIEGYTTAPAQATGRTAELGSLTVGKLADVTVLDQDPWSVPPEELQNIRAALTVVAGKVVYRA